MGFLQRQVLRGVLRVVAWPKLTLAIAGAVLVASIAITVGRLTISTDQNKLFSSDVKFFKDYIDFTEKFPENEALFVVIEAKDPHGNPPIGRWTALADRLAERLGRMPQYVKSVDCRVPLDRLGAQGILFDEPARAKQTIEEAKRFVPLVKLWAEKPDFLTGLLGSSPLERFVTGLRTQKLNAQAAEFLRVVAESWTKTVRTVGTAQTSEGPLRLGEEIPDLAAMDATDPSRLGYYYVPDETDRSRHLMLVKVFHQQNYASLTAISETVEAIRGAVRDAAGEFPEFTVGLTGRPALEADEMRMTDRDTHRAEFVALSVVYVGLVIMLRSIWLALAAELSLAVGIGWTFGYATLTVGELNLLSVVFLIALIGIGMDYLIQILVAYRREAARYARQSAIWARVFRYVGPPIVTACLGAAGAFFVSVFTPFRGAAELGIIAGGGLLLCLLAGYTVLPAMLVLWPPKVKEIDPGARYAEGQRPGRKGIRRLLLPGVWIAALAAGAPFAARVGFNPNLLDLQAPNLESVKLVRKLQTWSAVVLSQDLDMLRKVRDAVAQSPAVSNTESILGALDNYSWLEQHKNDLPAIQWAEPSPIAPGDLAGLAVRAQALATQVEQSAPGSDAAGKATMTGAATALRRFSDTLAVGSDARKQQIASRLSEWQKKFIDQLRQLLTQLTPPPLDARALPPEIRDHLVSADGTYALYIHPKDDLWKREHLTRFVEDVETRVARVPGAPAVTGIAPNIHHSTASIERSFYYATAYALGLIFVLVFIDMRRIGQTLLAISVLALGLPMLIALMGLLDITWNFANFFGLPILIGAGHEYGVFMMHRYKEVMHDPRRVWHRWDASDRALLLCAFVTSSSFGFFWALGHHEGLRSLGLVMALGSACIYLATIMVVRPLLRWRLERKGVYRSVPSPLPSLALEPKEPSSRHDIQ